MFEVCGEQLLRFLATEASKSSLVVPSAGTLRSWTMQLASNRMLALFCEQL
jgi:hypothetical protein